MSIAVVVFWASIALVGYAYAGYPLVVWLLTRRRADSGSQEPREHFGSFAGERPWPFVSLVLAAYKEERFILPRLHNAIASNYPADRFEIIVGCDGQEDLTGELVQEFGDSRVRLMQFPVRRGKASVLNDCIPAACGEIVVLSDANTMMDSEAIRRLVRHFVDPNVGCVCGKLILVDPVTGQNADSLYWKYENFLKRCEGRLNALLGVNGGIYAIRKEDYQPIPANTIIDDFLIGMRIHQRGKRLLYDVTATACEETPATIDAEFHRRARIGAGGFQSLVWLRGLLHPRHGWVAFTFFSHKLLRWLCPALMLSALVANLCLLPDPLYRQMLIAQSLFYAAALVGYWNSTSKLCPRACRLPAMFVSMNLALVVGFWRWGRGIRSGTWKRTERTEAGQNARALSHARTDEELVAVGDQPGGGDHAA